MPPKTGTSAAPAGSGRTPRTRKPAAASSAGSARGTGAGTVAGPEPLMAVVRAVKRRSFEPRGENDNDRLTRSFHLTVGDVERAKATADGIQHRAYGTDIQDEVPKSLSAFVTWCLELGSTFWEDLLNDGQEFRRVRNLSPGPSPEGARRGAEKRAAARSSRAGES